MVHPYSIRRRRKERENRDRFDALIATPASGAFTMPADGRLRFVARAGAAAGTTAATLTGKFSTYPVNGSDVPTRSSSNTRTIKTPLLAAGGYEKIDRITRGIVVTPTAGFDVELDIGLGKWAKIGGA